MNNIPSEDDEQYVRTIKMICIENEWDYSKSELNINDGSVRVFFLVPESVDDFLQFPTEFTITELDFDSTRNKNRMLKLAKECRKIYKKFVKTVI